MSTTYILFSTITELLILGLPLRAVQLPLLLLMIAYTSSRPGAIIESCCYSGTNEALRYKDVRVTVVRNPHEIGNNVMVMEIDILLMKGIRNKGDL